MELILYYISESQNLLITFLILMFSIGVMAYLFLRNFRQDKKMKIFSYGLFLRMNNTDIFKLSIVVIRTFLAIYATVITNETMMYVCLIMIVILSLIYVIFDFRKIIYEAICTSTQIIMIYFVYIINNYMLEVGQTQQILLIKICLVAFIIVFTIYLLFDNVDKIAQNRADKNLKSDRVKERKKLLNGKAKRKAKATKGER